MTEDWVAVRHPNGKEIKDEAKLANLSYTEFITKSKRGRELFFDGLELDIPGEKAEIIQVSPIEAETPEEKRRRIRLGNVMLKNLAITSLNKEELELFVKMQDALLKQHKIESLGIYVGSLNVAAKTNPRSNSTEDLWTKPAAIPALQDTRPPLQCPACKRLFDPDWISSLSDHMIMSHGWTFPQIKDLLDNQGFAQADEEDQEETEEQQDA